MLFYDWGVFKGVSLKGEIFSMFTRSGQAINFLWDEQELPINRTKIKKKMVVDVIKFLEEEISMIKDDLLLYFLNYLY